MNMFDIFAQAQNGDAFGTMARQFGIDERQVESAVEALMPAFSTGFKRKTADPYGVSEFFETLVRGQQHTPYFEDVTKAFQPTGMQAGNELLGQFFGSKDVSRAVAAQAAQATGIGQEVMKQMLPVIASTLMGGMAKQSAANAQAFGASSAAGGNIFGQIVEQMMKQGMPQAQPTQRAERNPNPLDNPFGQILEQMFGNGQQVAPDDPSDNGRVPNPMNPDNNPLGRVFKDMMQQREAPGAQPQAQAEPTPSGTKNPYEELFGEMFETGRKTQENYQQSMEQIFDNYLQGMRR
ncbi:MAG: DUF937 domain-containing protein [Pseudomonadota bacterium]